MKVALWPPALVTTHILNGFFKFIEVNTLKIDHSATTTSGLKVNESKGQQNRVGSTPAPSSKPASDSVNITSLSSQLQALESSLSDVSVVDTARVNAIKQAISEGRFKINPEVVADKLLNSVKDLVLNQKG